MPTRSLDEQFEPPTAARIRRLSSQFGSIDYPDGTSRYYAHELRTVLEAGALLAALGVGSSLLEITVRELVLGHTGHTARASLDLQAELESKRRIGLAALLKALCDSDLFSAEDAAAANSLYETVRIPVLHGLPRRFVDLHHGDLADFRKLLRLGGVVSVRELEEVLEDNAIAHLEALAGILARNLPSKAA